MLRSPPRIAVAALGGGRDSILTRRVVNPGVRLLPGSATALLSPGGLRHPLDRVPGQPLGTPSDSALSASFPERARLLRSSRARVNPLRAARHFRAALSLPALLASAAARVEGTSRTPERPSAFGSRREVDDRGDGPSAAPLLRATESMSLASREIHPPAYYQTPPPGVARSPPASIPIRGPLRTTESGAPSPIQLSVRRASTSRDGGRSYPRSPRLSTSMSLTLLNNRASTALHPRFTPFRIRRRGAFARSAAGRDRPARAGNARRSPPTPARGTRDRNHRSR